MGTGFGATPARLRACGRRRGNAPGDTSGIARRWRGSRTRSARVGRRRARGTSCGPSSVAGDRALVSLDQVPGAVLMVAKGGEAAMVGRTTGHEDHRTARRRAVSAPEHLDVEIPVLCWIHSARSSIEQLSRARPESAAICAWDRPEPARGEVGRTRLVGDGGIESASVSFGDGVLSRRRRWWGRRTVNRDRNHRGELPCRSRGGRMTSHPASDVEALTSGRQRSGPQVLHDATYPITRNTVVPVPMRRIGAVTISPAWTTRVRGSGLPTSQ